MRIRASFLVVLMISIVTTVVAQDYTFRVIGSDGENAYKTSSSDWQSVRPGTKMNDGDMLKVADQGFVALVHSNGKTLQLTEPKEYEVTALDAQMGGEDAGIIKKYADYVMSKMTPEEREENRKKYASITGATERSLEDSKIDLFMKPSSPLLEEEAIIRWKEIGENSSYQVTIKDMFDEVIMVSETSDTYFKIDLTDERMKNVPLIIVTVNLKDNEEVKTGDYGIQPVMEEDMTTYVADLDELKQSLGEDTSINHLILAAFYEEQGLLLDATTNYEYAIKKSPGVSYFQEAYDEFLIRNFPKSIELDN